RTVALAASTRSRIADRVSRWSTTLRRATDAARAVTAATVATIAMPPGAAGHRASTLLITAAHVVARTTAPTVARERRVTRPSTAWRAPRGRTPGPGGRRARRPARAGRRRRLPRAATPPA